MFTAVQYSLAETRTPPPFPRIWAHFFYIRGRYYHILKNVLGGKSIAHPEAITKSHKLHKIKERIIVSEKI